MTVKSKEGKVDIAEFIQTLSVMLRGKTEERTKCRFIVTSLQTKLNAALPFLVCFEVYNLSKNNYISKFDIIQLLKNSILKPPVNVELEDFLKELIELTIKKLVGTNLYLYLAVIVSSLSELNKIIVVIRKVL